MEKYVFLYHHVKKNVALHSVLFYTSFRCVFFTKKPKTDAFETVRMVDGSLADIHRFDPSFAQTARNLNRHVKQC